MAETQRVSVRAEVEDEGGGVCTSKGVHPTHQGGVCAQAKLTESIAAASQHSGMSTQKPL